MKSEAKIGRDPRHRVADLPVRRQHQHALQHHADDDDRQQHADGRREADGGEHPRHRAADARSRARAAVAHAGGEERQQRGETDALEQAREHQGAQHQRALRGIGAAEGSE